jgi:hypothetical protein
MAIGRRTSRAILRSRLICVVALVGAMSFVQIAPASAARSAIDVSVRSVSFGTVSPGSDTLGPPVEILVSGLMTLAIDWPDPDPPFVVELDSCTGYELGGINGNGCIIIVNFNATTLTSGRFRGLLTVLDDSSGAPLATVRYSGAVR